MYTFILFMTNLFELKNVYSLLSHIFYFRETTYGCNMEAIVTPAALPVRDKGFNPR